MIFTSESGLIDPSRSGEWARWYDQHLRLMASVPGISSAQRFLTDSPGRPPSLAMYSVASEAVFTSPRYLEIRGLGEWLPRVDPALYRRNLFDGIETAPEVGERQVLLLVERDNPEEVAASRSWTWLRCTALDRTFAFRGLMVQDETEQIPDVKGIGTYRPAGPRYLGSSHPR
jgi:hypothetical protein